MTVTALIVGSRPEARELCARSLSSIYVVETEAGSAEDALAQVAADRPGVVLIDAADEGPLGLALCRAIKAGGDEAPAVLLFGAARARGGRHAALLAGADDFLELPRDNALLKARMRSLIRLRTMTDELALRRQTARELGLEAEETGVTEAAPARIVIASPASAAAEGVARAIERRLGVDCRIVDNGFAALRLIEEKQPDAVVVVDGALAGDAQSASGFGDGGDALDFVRTLAGRDAGRVSAVVLLSADQESRGGGVQAALALDAGAGDCAYADPEYEELAIRLDLHLRRKRCVDQLRRALDEGLRKAALDPLTSLFNRRYLDIHFERRFRRARETGAPLAAMLFDLDRFKAINDSVGHAGGDQALAAFARLLREEVRSADLACRYGGEEFVVVMPGATIAQATIAAERVRARTARELRASGLPVTVSVGVAGMRETDTGPADLLTRADDALRLAKLGGRNRVAGA